ncbi:signal transduction histidine kinase [Owenweeksia hongkongensis DSM 17368]|uniref:histidine kinase n=1 Tax=Owenweeksia hongkongensis (strain DSM 17368 / CIP 108786 / JCM 12287 / NRRL B-23963 / UST20020801) TaxID=926562 RepID=G8R663_OWEHD|nr:sensor histidine kinase [Owenweeksia hongkongensis]AEV32253.1 signal transduction histidine kinase [Owenweeksia hongkongensis DSM 17368]
MNFPSTIRSVFLIIIFYLATSLSLKAQSGNKRKQSKNLVNTYLDSAWNNYVAHLPFDHFVISADSIAKSEGLPELFSTIYGYKGLYFSSIGNTDSSIYYQLQAIKIFESVDSLAPKLVNAYYNLADTYERAELDNKALFYARKSLEQAKIMGNSVDVRYCYTLIASILTSMANHIKDDLKNYSLRSEAIKESRKALRGSNYDSLLSFEFNALLSLSDNYREIYALPRDGENYTISHYLDSAEKYNNIAYSHTPDSMVHLKNVALAQKSFILQERGEFDEALELLNQAGKVLMMNSDLSNVQRFYKAKEDLYLEMGIMDSAFYYQKLHYNISDSIADLETRKYTNQLETQYETAKKEKRIQALETQSKLQKAKNQLSLTVAIAIGVILIIVIYFLIQNRKKSKRLAEQNKIIQQSHKEIEDLIRESHHRIKNNLQVVSSLLKMQSKNAKSEETKANLLEAFNRVKTIAVLHQKLQGSQTFKQIQMQEFVSQLTEAIQGSVMSSNQDIQLSTDVDPILLSTDQSISIGLIINEVLTNSFKYAFAEKKGSIILQLKEEETDNIILKIYDDGKGLPEDFDISQNPSLGYKIINSMTVKLKGKLDISGINGTCTSIHFKKTPIA